jgi:hypothetical protein
MGASFYNMPEINIDAYLKMNHAMCWLSAKTRIDLAEPDAVSLGQTGVNIGIVIGRSIEAETKMGLETVRFGPILDRSPQGACSKKYPAKGWDERFLIEWSCVLLRLCRQSSRFSL